MLPTKYEMQLCFELIASAPVSPRGAVFIHLEFAYLFLQPSGHGTSSTELHLASDTIPVTDTVMARNK